jgi:hydrogenase nickel incorporation protein HypB
MCENCGCSDGEIAIHTHSHSDREHSHHHHEHSHVEQRRSLTIAQSILSKNDRLAERNRCYFLSKGLLVLNILSSPGSGKTAFIERTITEWTTEMAEEANAIASSLKDRLKVGVIVGDLETDNDAKRLCSSGAPVIQITTGGVCHLEADMVLQASQKIDLDSIEVLIIENVGNLVCPAAYDLGEDLRVVLLSVTEGEDKPLKYPTMFKSADVVIVNKIDIAEAVEFDRDRALTNIQKIIPEATIFEVSARTGVGMNAWYGYLEEKMLSRSHRDLVR